MPHGKNRKVRFAPSRLCSTHADWLLEARVLGAWLIWIDAGVRTEDKSVRLKVSILLRSYSDNAQRYPHALLMFPEIELNDTLEQQFYYYSVYQSFSYSRASQRIDGRRVLKHI